VERAARRRERPDPGRQGLKTAAAQAFDPNSASAAGSGVFGLPFSERESALVLLPVPWEATVSYGGGTSQGPAAILAASRQVDLFAPDIRRPYEAGICMLAPSRRIRSENAAARRAAAPVIAAGGWDGRNSRFGKAAARVNAAGARLNALVRAESARILAAGKILGVVGGEHSVPFGAIQAAAARSRGFGILHLDAHSDTRDAFEGLRWSHASIMRNVLEDIPQVRRLVQVGIRDFCEEEHLYCRGLGKRVRTFRAQDLAAARFAGKSWDRTARDIVARLPKDVWVSFDIDALDPSLCPHTGTPVPGGLGFWEADHLLSRVVRSGRRIIGFDLCEVAPGRDDEWDANVGARILYRLCSWTLASQGKAALG